MGDAGSVNEKERALTLGAEPISKLYSAGERTRAVKLGSQAAALICRMPLSSSPMRLMRRSLQAIMTVLAPSIFVASQWFTRDQQQDHCHARYERKLHLPGHTHTQ